ncbi:MAG TPA: type 4a pilus biogenesis protein PilO [Fimbriimonadaceae bacterium]|nr:type 4a pilus biogenesis protein PilO [Fimbriimonadaceae bacterium]
MLIGTAAWYWMPLPSVQGFQSRSYSKQLASANNSTTDVQNERVKLESDILPFLWEGLPDKVAPAALAKVNDLAKQRALKVVAFRPQKPSEVKGLTQVVFGVTVDGSFPNTVQFIKDLEQPGLKLAVSTVQIASADQASDRVTGTVNIVAYIKGATKPVSRGDKNVKKS